MWGWWGGWEKGNLKLVINFAYIVFELKKVERNN